MRSAWIAAVTRMAGGDDGLDRVPAGQVHLGMAQGLRAQQGGDAGDQRGGGARPSVTELAEQVSLGPYDIDAARLSMLKLGLAELWK
jgi:hypothetical protein